MYNNTHLMAKTRKHNGNTHNKSRARKRKRNHRHTLSTNDIYAPIPAVDKDITALIDVAAIKQNVAYLRKMSGTDIMPVLKSNAYGHGIVEMSRTLRSIGIKYLGVATIGEAIMLRRNGDTGRILAWLYDIDGPDLIDAFHMEPAIDIAIFDDATVEKFIRLIPKGRVIKVTVFVDTGINRSGVPYDNAFELFCRLRECPNVEIEGMMSHLVCSGIKNSPIVNEQLHKFRELRARLADINILPPLVHIANTDACLNYDVSDFTLARPGSGIYGLTARFEPHGHMKLAMSLKTHLIQIKEIEKGAGVGYDWLFVAPRKMKIGILPIGYADIIPRDMTLKTHVYINGSKRRVLGAISMDQVMVEARDGDRVGEDVYIFGNGRDCPQTVYNLAKMSNTIPHEILCHAGYRVRRQYA
jgi:alanine racemase